ncbi:alpha/beta fold hydrolase [Aestuariibacter sp. A3R04]|uniref:alpha/beta fold hydrolase n=1 Tax=Aestuariibacter sp. A3R04 TaxID=2841571 RepID=UPI001C088D6A|nr:alpha/beta fold hydrolase [Aestuariibacter sp. A3R04]MBU3020819.1 alpha/beta fold hydrolase [Aestuariibacter sp. A3R04]
MAWKITSEAQLDSALPEIAAFWSEHVVTGTIPGVDDVPLAYAWCVPASPKGTVVISSGRIEAYLKYKEVIYDFYNNGFAVFIHDHRGQGLSGRMSENPHHGYVSSFDDYVADLLLFIDNVVRVLAPEGPRYLLAHSMGAAIGVLTALRAPDAFERLVLCSPMFGIRPALPEWMTSALLNASMRKHTRKGRQTGYFFGQRDYAPVPFNRNKLTHSQVRYGLFRQLYKENSSIQLGGVTVTWLKAAMSAMREIENRIGGLSAPCLVLSAGADEVVDNRKQIRVAGRLPMGSLHTISNARHELLIETDDIRCPVMTLILDFLSEPLPTASL